MVGLKATKKKIHH